MTSVCFQGRPFNTMVIQVCAPTNNAEEAEVDRFYEDLQELLELTPPKRCPFHYRGLECKSRKSRDTWSNRHVCLGVQNEAGQRLTELCQDNTLVHSKYSLPAIQEMILLMDIMRWSIQIDYILCS